MFDAGVGILADETRAELDEPRAGGSMVPAGSSHSDISNSVAAAEDPAKDKLSLTSAGGLSATDPRLEDTGPDEDRLEPKSSSRDIVGGSDSLVEKAEGKDSARPDSLLQEKVESDLEQDDEKTSTGSAQPAAKSAAAEEAAAGVLEPKTDPFLHDSALAADGDPAGSADDAAKPSNSEAARAAAITAEIEPTAGDEDAAMLKPIDDPFLTDGSRGSGSMHSGEEERELAGTQSDSASQTDKVDRDSQEEPYMMSRLDDEDEEWEDEALFNDSFEEDELLAMERDDAKAVGR